MASPLFLSDVLDRLYGSNRRENRSPAKPCETFRGRSVPSRSLLLRTVSSKPVPARWSGKMERCQAQYPGRHLAVYEAVTQRHTTR